MPVRLSAQEHFFQGRGLVEKSASARATRPATVRCSWRTALGEHARDVGAPLLLEPVNRCEDHTLAQAVGLVRAVGLPSVRVVGDVFRMSIEEVGLDASMRAAAPYLAHF